jgi:hypothetical protein
MRGRSRSCRFIGCGTNRLASGLPCAAARFVCVEWSLWSVRSGAFQAQVSRASRRDGGMEHAMDPGTRVDGPRSSHSQITRLEALGIPFRTCACTCTCTHVQYGSHSLTDNKEDVTLAPSAPARPRPRARGNGHALASWWRIWLMNLQSSQIASPRPRCLRKSGTRSSGCPRASSLSRWPPPRRGPLQSACQ